VNQRRLGPLSGGRQHVRRTAGGRGRADVPRQSGPAVTEFRPPDRRARRARITRKGQMGTGGVKMVCAVLVGADPVHETVNAVYLSDSRRVLATLIRLLGDFDTAEE